jgi:hypothetical protein
MTTTRNLPRWARCATTLTGLLVIPALAAGCAQDPDDTGAGDDTSASDGTSAGDDGGGPTADPGGGTTAVVDPACPEELTAQQLGAAVDYAPADVDGDGTEDTMSIGTVTGGEAGCSAALVVATADSTAVAALPGLEIVPSRAIVPGGAATIDGQAVIAAPLSFSPRGGGEVGLFTLQDGALVPLEDQSGKPWTIFATVDDGGGVPQGIGCADDGLTHTTTSQNGLGGPVHLTTTHYTLDGTTVVKDGQEHQNVTERGSALGDHGLSIFADC